MAFYASARGVLKVLDHMIAEGDYEGLQKVIERHGRLLKRSGLERDGTDASTPPVICIPKHRIACGS